MPRNSTKQTAANQPEERESAANTTDQAIVVDAAKHHVGRTLESDPEYNDQPARELAPQAGLIDPHGNDITASPDLRDTAQRLRDAFDSNEPLKTRLPGDTSSDPHTDLGPDNATVVQLRSGKKRGEDKRGEKLSKEKPNQKPQRS